MERQFDSRALLKATEAYLFKETKVSEAYKRLMNTDTLDLELEDRLHDVLEERGVELFTKEYDKAIRELQDEYLRERNGYVEENFDFKGQPCGASHISASYKCRIGGFDFAAATSEENNKRLAKKVEAYEEAKKAYSPEAQKGFDKAVEDAVKSQNYKYSNHSEEYQVKNYEKILDNAKTLADDGPPVAIRAKDGSEVSVSEFMAPRLAATGQMAWTDPVSNISYTKHRPGEMDLEQNRENLPTSLVHGRVKDALKHYDQYQNSPTLQAKGEFGSPAVAKQRDVSQKEIDAEWKKLSPEQQRRVALSGVDGNGGRIDKKTGLVDDRSAHRGFYDNNPDQLEFRGKEVMAAYLQQTPRPGAKAISPFTGKEVDLPGAYGEKGSVVDHYSALSNHYPQNRTTKQWTRDQGLATTRIADVRGNIVIVEKGLNQSKGDREDWTKIMGSWKKAQASYEKRQAESEKFPRFARSGGSAAPLPVKKTRVKVDPPKGGAARSRSGRSKTKDKSEPKKAPSKQPTKSEAMKNLADRVKQLKGQGMTTAQIKAQLSGTLKYLNGDQQKDIGL